MPGDSHSFVLGGSGPSHHGSGSQHVYVGFQPPGQGRDGLHIVRDRRAELRRRFVHPGHYGEAAGRLEAPGAVVLLQGPPGIGRSAAATMLLHEATDTGPGEKGRFEQLTADKPEGRLDAGPHDRFLLDLSGTAYDYYPEAQETLAYHRAAVEQAKARLVVVLPTGLDHLLDPQFGCLTVRLERPLPIAVVRLGLRVAGIDCEADQLRPPALAAFITDVPMRELARFCETVVRARDGGRHGTEFDAWCEEALAAVTDRAAEAAQQVASLETAEERGLLLAAAMLHGASADAVFHSRNALLEELGHSVEDPPGLAGGDLLDQLKSLGIRRDREGLIAFEHLEYDAAVRRHFWLSFPALRGALCNWIEQTITLDDLTRDDRADLVSRFTEQVLAAGRPDDLLDVAEQWAGNLQPSLLGEATAALELGLSDERHGRAIRQKIRVWATAPELPRGLFRLLTGVCRGMMSVTHPHQAVVRLHHLARHGADARDALFELVRADVGLRRFLISRIAAPAQAGPRALGNLELLLGLLAESDPPPPLPWRELTGVWRAAMDHSTPDYWSPPARAWLTAFTPAPGARREPALDVLVNAVSGSDRHSNQLYAITCDWARNRPERQPTATWLWQQIDAAQGLAADDVFAPSVSGGTQ
ncbi:hypothetical protein [Streptomyces sp. NPDC091371]|uniref:hypothetical protein n=1 Tax=Streptomyces sp. NPDC091371 TaxID=3155303 RepID=UPI003414BF25